MRWLFIALFFPFTEAWCQINQFWSDITFQKQTNKEHWSWSAEAGIRFQEKDGFFAAYTRGTLNYQVSKVFSITGSLAYFIYDSSPSRLTGHDLRPSQGMRLDLKLPARITFSNYVRLEERFLLTRNSTDFILRLRFQTAVNFMLYQKNESDFAVYLPLSFEIFEDINKQLFINRNRLDIGGGLGFAHNRIELHYLAQQGRFNEEEEFQLLENIFRIRWFRRL